MQVEGAFVQGLGLFTMEELHYSPEGSLHTRGPSTYKIPAFGSIPIELRVSLLRECPNRKAIYASKVPSSWVCGAFWPALREAAGGDRGSSQPPRESAGVSYGRERRGFDTSLDDGGEVGAVLPDSQGTELRMTAPLCG